ncbi:MAG: CAP domain-containing protein [Lautropia sp.]|nr:CAP domain-containing protein [Lautropia sp.]
MSLAAVLLAGCAGGSGHSSALDPALGDGNAAAIRAEYQALHGMPPGAHAKDALQTKLGFVPVSDAQGDDAGRFHDLAEEVVRKVNQVRAQGRFCGSERMEAAPALRWDARVAYAALLESEWMRESNRFDHAWESGELVWDRFDIVGYPWSKADENIAAGFRTLDEAIQAWIDSPSHCRAMMRGDIEDIGLAVVPGNERSRYRSYWTMALGTLR